VQPGFVVNRPFRDSNVGSNLSSLVGALWIAQQLERELIVDWRGLRQLRDESLNYFSEFLSLPEAMLGVRLHSAPLAGATYDEGSESARWIEPAEAREIATNGGNGLPRYLVLQTYHGLDRVHPGPEASRLRLMRAFYRELRPATRIQQVIDTWAADSMTAPFVVGVNVRTGNGAYFHTGDRYADRVDISLFENERRFMGLLESVCRARLETLPPALRQDFQIFYATDSAEMSQQLARLPNAITRRRTFPPPGEGDLYAFGDSDYTDRDSIEDTITDMFLLARCDALVYNTSLFNQYARVVTGYFGGNQVHFETILLRKRLQRLAMSARRRLG
jgi:Nodulation protein Z (NodZ)